MSEKYMPIKGDRVRVVLEGEVGQTWGDNTFDVGNYEAGGCINHIILSQEHVVSVEKIEPGAVLPDGLTISEDGSLLNWLGENYVRQPDEKTVEVFKPGDVVRSKAAPSAIFAITQDGPTEGYVYLPTGEVFGKGLFTSKKYERVTLS